MKRVELNPARVCIGGLGDVHLLLGRPAGHDTGRTGRAGLRVNFSAARHLPRRHRQRAFGHVQSELRRSCVR